MGAAASQGKMLAGRNDIAAAIPGGKRYISIGLNGGSSGNEY
jgi:hypothetical protein